MKVTIGEQEFDVQPGESSVTVGGEPFAVRVVRNHNIVTVYVNEKPHAVQLPDVLPEEGPVDLLVDAKPYSVEVTGRAGRAKPKAAAKKKSSAATGAIMSQMTGRITRVDVKVGDTVSEGNILLVIEAMKMENEIAAPLGGTVKELLVNAGARVSEGDPLLVIEPAAAD
ncbi:MAG TPA: biotin/lipoyl-containing protein [Dehalococcoidia bacterium]|nr:biotin/lipoyl-containing protein [Dehalococcoidia bacterium]